MPRNQTGSLELRTTGNATLIAYKNGRPILSTDPWMGEEHTAYFGSWNLSHTIPPELQADAKRSTFVWFSHGHPDHLNPDSINLFTSNHILLPNHFGARIADGLRETGFQVSILADRRWHCLEPDIRIMCITTVDQDAILLLDLGGTLFVNLNDAGTRGCTPLLRKIITSYERKYLMALAGYGDADMINFWDEAGNFVEPIAATNTDLAGNIVIRAQSLGIDRVIPFSSMHVYQRDDSVWAMKYVAPLSAYPTGIYGGIEFLPAFVALEPTTGAYTHIPHTPRQPRVISAEAFGDNWSDRLEAKEFAALQDYFLRKQKICSLVGFVRFRVGGKDHTIRTSGPKHKGMTFEVPRGSLMKAVGYEIFDDLLIGNFMKTTLHNMRSLYEGNFSQYLTKYADNGRAETREQLKAYFDEYNRRVGIYRFYEAFLNRTGDFARRFLPQQRNSFLYTNAYRLFYLLK